MCSWDARSIIASPVCDLRALKNPGGYLSVPTPDYTTYRISLVCLVCSLSHILARRTSQVFFCITITILPPPPPPPPLSQTPFTRVAHEPQTLLSSMLCLFPPSHPSLSHSFALALVEPICRARCCNQSNNVCVRARAYVPVPMLAFKNYGVCVLCCVCACACACVLIPYHSP